LRRSKVKTVLVSPLAFGRDNVPGSAAANTIKPPLPRPPAAPIKPFKQAPAITGPMTLLTKASAWLAWKDEQADPAFGRFLGNFAHLARV
jgi:hypothetical protein